MESHEKDGGKHGLKISPVKNAPRAKTMIMISNIFDRH